MPRTPPGRQDPAAGPGPAPAVVTREASSWAHVHSQPHSPLLGVPCLSFPVCPIAPFIQGWVQCPRGAHLPRLLSGSRECPPGWAGGPREASSRWLPQHPEGCSEWTSLHNLPQGSPLLQGGDQGPEGPSEGTSGLGNMAKGTVRQRDGHHGQQLCSPSSSGSRPRPSALPGLLTLRPPCRQSPLPPPPAPPATAMMALLPPPGGPPGLLAPDPGPGLLRDLGKCLLGPLGHPEPVRTPRCVLRSRLPPCRRPLSPVPEGSGWFRGQVFVL